MTTEPAARPPPALHRATASSRPGAMPPPSCPAARTRTSAPGARTPSTSTAARAAGSGTWTATSSWTCGWATARSILGHGDDRVDDYVNERMRRGVSFSPHLGGRDPGQRAAVQELTGWVEMARMTVSGTEATMHAMRVARAFTGRDKIVKFEGQYHGVHDYALISVLPNNIADLGDADNPVAPGLGPGDPGAGRGHDHPGPLQQHRARCARLFEREGDDIAAIIVEPVLGNAQGIMPQPGFHQAMRALTQEFGVLLIFDEVKTGFRLRPGGAAELFGITPGPRHVRQGDGQRLPGGGVRRPARDHGDAAQERQPRRHLCREPGRGRGGDEDPARSSGTRTRSRRSDGPGEAIQAGIRAGPRPDTGCRT